MALPAVANSGGQIDGISRLPFVRQAILMVGLAAAVAAGTSVVLWAQKPNLSVLYSGLTEKDSGMVIDALEKAHIQFQVGGEGAVLVPEDKVHDLRIKLAAQGLPKGNAVGFESLSESQGFGVSQFMETARYQRALEVELSRSISTLTNVQNARVHLAIPKRTVFMRDKQKPSASVLISLYPGRNLEDEQVAAVTHLVSSSIPDLDASQVTIVDQRGHLLTGKQSLGEVGLSAAQFDYQQRMERSFITRVEDLLAPIVGKDSVHAQVAAELDFTYNEKTEEVFNPENPAVRSEQLVQERSANGSEGGIPGALSNQPPGEAKAPEKIAAPAAPAPGAPGKAGEAAKAEATPTNSKSRTVKNYEVDRTISHTRLGTGGVKRLTVAVVIDDRLTPADGGQTIRTPYSPEEIERFTNLVKEAVGYSTQRGDSVSVINAAFTVPAAPEPLPEVPLWKRPYFWDYVKQGFGAALVLFLVIGVLRIMKQIAQNAKNAHPVIVRETASEEMAEDQVTLNQPPPPPKIQPPKVNHNLNTVKDMVKQDPKLVAQVVKGWVATDG